MGATVRRVGRVPRTGGTVDSFDPQRFSPRGNVWDTYWTLSIGDLYKQDEEAHHHTCEQKSRLK